MKTINVNNAIENFLGGQSDKAGKEWLMKEMKKDPALAREVTLRRKTDEILADRQVMELRDKLGAIEKRKRSSGTIRRAMIKSAKYAAAVALMAVISSVLYLLLKPDPIT